MKALNLQHDTIDVSMYFIWYLVTFLCRNKSVHNFTVIEEQLLFLKMQKSSGKSTLFFRQLIIISINSLTSVFHHCKNIILLRLKKSGYCMCYHILVQLNILREAENILAQNEVINCLSDKYFKTEEVKVYWKELPNDFNFAFVLISCSELTDWLVIQFRVYRDLVGS